MNRLIIIGNGFDLAHGLETSYHHFITSYMYNVLKYVDENNQYNDKLISIERRNSPFVPERLILNKSTIVKEFISLIKNNNFYKLNFRSDFFSKICRLSASKWVDIEVFYFHELVKAKGNRKTNAVNQLQKEFAEVKKELIDYLSKQELKIPLTPPTYRNHFFSDFSNDEFKTRTISERSPNKVLFLNFNYTNTFENYLQSPSSSTFKSVYIHGSLDKKHGNPIFGFGDDLNKEYLQFEDQMDNDLYKYMKTFEYFANQNYHELLGFLEPQEFQVHIYGHSCGISDRTMLYQIFEHENCQSIKIYYYKNGESNDYFEKLYEMSRHFEDKGLFRSKVVSFEMSNPMPQPHLEYKKMNGKPISYIIPVQQSKLLYSK